MPRMNRIQMPGSLAHIMAHSVEGRDLFVDDDDRYEFLARFEKNLSICGYQCFAWTLMDNHYHFLVQTNHLPMSKLMQPLNSGYARYYNKKYGRSGYLFQGRFKSILCQDQDYAKKLIRYIHLNPLRAGIVKSPEQLKNWTWCGHGCLIGINEATGKSFQNREKSLRRFGTEEKEAIQNYLNFLFENYDISNPEAVGLLSNEETATTDSAFKGWPTVIGDQQFAKKAMEMYKNSKANFQNKTDYINILEKTAINICKQFEVNKEELLQKNPKGNLCKARAAFCYQAHIVETLPIKAIASFLNLTISPVSVLVQNGALLKGNEHSTRN